MKAVFLALMMFSVSTVHAQTINVHPGKTKSISIQEIQDLKTQEIVIQCSEEKECRIDHKYVGNKFDLTLPNGKVYGEYKTKEEALRESSSLVQAKVCDRTVINFDQTDHR